MHLESDRGASFEIKLEDPEADLTQVYVSFQSELRPLLVEKIHEIYQVTISFPRIKRRKFLTTLSC